MPPSDLTNRIKSVGDRAVASSVAGNYQLAIDLNKEGLQICQDVFPYPQNKNTLNFKYNLAENLWNVGQYKEAKGLDLEVLQAWETTLGDKHEDTVRVRGRLAKDYAGLRNHEKAAHIFQKNLHILENKPGYGRAHPLTLESRYYVAEQLYYHKKFQEAIDLLEINLAMCKKTLDPDDENIIGMQNLLAKAKNDLKSQQPKAEWRLLESMVYSGTNLPPDVSRQVNAPKERAQSAAPVSKKGKGETCKALSYE